MTLVYGHQPQNGYVTYMLHTKQKFFFDGNQHKSLAEQAFYM